MTRTVVLSLVLSASLGGPAAAQIAPSVIRGTVQDQTGAVVPGVEVRVVDASGTVRAETRTDSSGAFVVQDLPPGDFEVRTAFEGFKPTIARIRVTAGRAVPRLKLTLELADVRQEITVGRDESSLTTAAENNRDAVVLGDKALRELPIFDRDVVGTLSRFLDAGAIGTGGVTLVVDGMEARKVGVAPSAIQQVKVNQDPYSAEYARPGRGRIEIVTKAGSENYRGSFDLTFRDAHLNARDAFAPTRPPEQRRIYEGVLGGPIRGGRNTSFLTTIDRKEEDLQSIVYADTLPGLVRGVVAQPARSLEVSASVNHQQGKPHTISVRFTAETQVALNQGVGGTTLPESGSDDHADEEQVVVGHRWVRTSRFLNEWRLLVGREVQHISSLHGGPRIIVADAFTGGGAQSDQWTTEYHFQLAQAATYARGRHVLKAGVSIPDWSRRGFDDRSNRDGTFTFASLQDFAAGLPLSFAQQRGDGRLVFLQKVFGAFVQDQVTLRPNLSLGAGLRYDWQNIFIDNNNLAPRASIAYAPGQNTVIRAGAGVFYDRANDSTMHDLLRSREARLFRYLVLTPGYPDPFASTGSQSTPPPSIVQVAPDEHTPLSVQYSAGIERQIHKGTTVAVNYTGMRGVDLFRSRDANAPRPPLFAARPDPALGQVRQIESSGRLQSHSLQFMVRGKMAPHVQGTAQYTLATAHNDTSGINTFPANNYDLSGEWGPADFDQPHKLDLLGQVKAGPWVNVGINLAVASGRPYSIRTGRDDYRTGQILARPAGVPRNSARGPGSAVVDLRWSREFGFGPDKEDRPTVMLGVDAFNLLNHVNYSTIIGNLSSPFYGRAISAQPPRRFQLTAGVTF